MTVQQPTLWVLSSKRLQLTQNRLTVAVSIYKNASILQNLFRRFRSSDMWQGTWR